VIVDSSVVVALLLREPGYEPLLERLAGEEDAGIGAPTLTETGIVLGAKLGVPGRSLVARFVQESRLVVIAFSELHWPVAIDAFQRFGKRRHPAGLNFGDCMTYATARLAAEPLLCLGDDFAKTDLELVG
jgi:ribonuclease VapC